MFKFQKCSFTTYYYAFTEILLLHLLLKLDTETKSF
jgi:hypothetical protein